MGHEKKYSTDELLGKFYEGSSSKEEEATLCDLLSTGRGKTGEERAAAVMSELFRQEREVCYPGSVATLRRRRSFSLVFRSAAAAVAAVIIVLGATVFRPEPQTVYCFVDGRPVTDYHAAMEEGARVFEIISESLDKTASMLQPLDEVSRAMKELERLGAFESLSTETGNERHNS